ncbi:hypothetical protein [Mesorhizobium sp. B2-7-1]|uniref:hypothetical protein n=1 Tax=Mesorhizobium sp. B2-7-1 TaxID=2589909 RepID=UPI001FEE50F5|nr:hypothetical protein [Mesorhizobium sp. B2-7-1]
MLTTKPNVLVATCPDKNMQHAALRDAALLLMNGWQMTRYVSLLLCRVQRRLESRMMVNPGIRGLTGDSLKRTEGQAEHIRGDRGAYAVAREAEVLAMTETLKLQDIIPEVAVTSLAGVIAKLDRRR